MFIKVTFLLLRKADRADRECEKRNKKINTPAAISMAGESLFNVSLGNVYLLPVTAFLIPRVTKVGDFQGCFYVSRLKNTNKSKG